MQIIHISNTIITNFFYQVMKSSLPSYKVYASSNFDCVIPNDNVSNLQESN